MLGATLGRIGVGQPGNRVYPLAPLLPIGQLLGENVEVGRRGRAAGALGLGGPLGKAYSTGALSLSDALAFQQREEAKRLGAEYAPKLPEAARPLAASGLFTPGELIQLASGEQERSEAGEALDVSRRIQRPTPGPVTVRGERRFPGEGPPRPSESLPEVSRESTDYVEPALTATPTATLTKRQVLDWMHEHNTPRGVQSRVVAMMPTNTPMDAPAPDPAVQLVQAAAQIEDDLLAQGTPPQRARAMVDRYVATGGAYKIPETTTKFASKGSAIVETPPGMPPRVIGQIGETQPKNAWEATWELADPNLPESQKTRLRATLKADEEQKTKIAKAGAIARQEAVETTFTPEAIAGMVAFTRATGEIPPLGFSPAGRAKFYTALRESFASEGGMASFAGRQALVRSLRQGLGALERQRATIEAFMKTNDKNLTLAETLSSALARSDYPVANRLLIPYKIRIAGDADTAALSTALLIARNEAARVLTSATGAGMVTDTARAEIGDTLNISQNPEMVHRVIRVLRQDMENRLRSYNEERTQLLQTIQTPELSMPSAGSPRQSRPDTSSPTPPGPRTRTFNPTTGKLE